ncbi:glycosyltransferase [Cohnella sp. GbtcB17]|uniref:glycosyltransferase n=1 Tax=Cohnella sp. GbtcB17 TaxID=2824762 RepID=UPI001C2F9573|nr:glycosyltransferase [Cohnella sp. GbtcB17]
MLKYDHEINFSETTSHKIILDQIEPNSKVLELGTATGYMTKYMKETLGCFITGIEMDSQSARIASQYCEELVLADLEDLSWFPKISNREFDYIICADVLEHLRNPSEVLLNAIKLLKKNGTVIVSVPNIGHNAIIMDLINGKFNYRKLGLLDDTHVKFFTRENLLNMLDEVELTPINITATFALPENTEFQQNYGLVSDGFRSSLTSNKDGHVYQFIAICKKNEEVNHSFTVEFDIDKEELKPRINYKFAQLFFSKDENFSEENSFKFSIDASRVTISCEFKNNNNVIRFDPINFPGVINSLRLEVIDEENRKVYEWGQQPGIVTSLTNMQEIDENFLLCLDSDPQIIISLPILGNGRTLKMNAEFEYNEDIHGVLLSELDAKKKHIDNLSESLAHEKQSLALSVSQNLEIKSELSTKEKYHEEVVSSLESRIDAITDSKNKLESNIFDLNEKINQITHSTSWKLTSPLRFLGTVLRHPKESSRNIAYFILGKKWVPKLLPMNQIEKLENDRGWKSLGTDPQFYIDPQWLTGWVEVTLLTKTEKSSGGRARFYFDSGKGFSEENSVVLGPLNQENHVIMYIEPTTRIIRMDPMEAMGLFEIKKLYFKKASFLTVRIGKRWSKVKERGKKVQRFVRFGLSNLKEWKLKRGRYPRIAEMKPLVKKALYLWRSRQLVDGGNLLPPEGFEFSERINEYQSWLEVNEWNERQERAAKEDLSNLAYKPLLSIVMPVYNPPLEFLEKAILSVINQVYTNWELCIADDASTDIGVRDVLETWSKRDSRIKVLYCNENGNISRATNYAASLASGEFYVFMDNDDELTPNALLEISKYINSFPETDFLYSDDDKMDQAGNRFAPQFKPQWSPELLLSFMYLSHIVVIRSELFNEVGGARVGFEGSQDYDLALRATERARHIGHIPKILYHWRVLPGSTAQSGDAKPASIEAGRKAVQEAFDRRGVKATVYQPDWAKKAACGIFDAKFPDIGPKVAIIIPTKNQYGVLKKCIDSLERTTYKNFEVFVIDNDSDDQETIKYLSEFKHRVLKISNPENKFSFAFINNRAVEQIDAEYVLFLNNDTEVITPDWLSQMMGYAQINGVGTVGARLIFPDGRIQHAGITHGLYHGMVGPSFKLIPSWDNGYLSLANVSRNSIAVTAACMLTKRKLFLEIGGFDEANFAVAYNDVDYCYRLNEAGFRSVYCSTAELRHYEGYTRGYIDNPSESKAFREKYDQLVDPYYNDNLSLMNEKFEIQSKVLAPKRQAPIRTLMCAFNLNLEGAPYCQFELTVELMKLGVIDPIVYCPHDGPLRKLYEDKGIKVHVFDHPLIGVYGKEAYLKAIKQFASVIAEWDVELIYGNTLQTFYVIEAAKLMDIPSIWNPRESEPWQTYFNHFDAEIASSALHCFDYPYKVIFVSDASRERFMPLNSRHNFMTIHDGLDSTNFADRLHSYDKDKVRLSLGVSDEEIVVLLLGTVCERKGQHDLIKAINELTLPIASKCKYLIVGDRPSEYSLELKRLISNLDQLIRNNVIVIPETSEAAKYYAIADIFVCTSRIESYPRVILEAMSCGLPVITTPVFGIVEQVQQKVNGLFYSPGEAQELAKHLEFILSNEDERKRMGTNSKVIFDTINRYDEMAIAYGETFKEAWFSCKSR